MTANFDRGILTASTWHQMNEIGELSDAPDMIAQGERTGAWPVELRSLVPSVLVAGVDVAAVGFNAITALYRNHTPRVVGVNGSRYNATTPGAWRDLVTAAVAAGASPSGAFSLRDGRAVLATFEVGESKGIKTQLVLADSFDGSSKLMCGFTSIRVVCCNTLAAAFNSDGKSWAQIRHTASLDEKIARLGEGITASIESGDKIASTFEQACDVHLPRAAAIAAFDAFFPEANDDASARAKTLATQRRDDAAIAAAMPCNRVGGKGNLATLWNAATYLVDRNADGSRRETRGGDNMVDSMLFGSRGKRVQEVLHLVDVILADGTVESMTVAQATGAGVDSKQLGAGLLAAMLEG
jgi:hypothetical protein